jgi:hypothetical protein
MHAHGIVGVVLLATLTVTQSSTTLPQLPPPYDPSLTAHCPWGEDSVPQEGATAREFANCLVLRVLRPDATKNLQRSELTEARSLLANAYSRGGFNSAVFLRAHHLLSVAMSGLESTPDTAEMPDAPTHIVELARWSATLAQTLVLPEGWVQSWSDSRLLVHTYKEIAYLVRCHKADVYSPTMKEGRTVGVAGGCRPVRWGYIL